MKIKILFFLPTLGGGGAEKVTLNIIKLLDKNLFEVHLAVLNMNGAVFNIPNNVVLHDLQCSKTLFSFRKLRTLIIRLQPNIVYSSLLRGHIAVDIAVSMLRKKPFLIFRSPNSPKLLLEHNELSIIQTQMLNHAYKKADLVIAQTPEMKIELHQYHNLNLEKIEVLLNPIDTVLIDEMLQDNTVVLPFNNNNINVIAAGRLTKQKGFDILIKSFKYVIAKNKNFRLYIIGADNGAEKELKILRKSLDLENIVYFLGFQENPYKYYAKADLFVLSSRWEGLPNAVLENLYLKKPIIATRCIPFMDELIIDGENGILVDIENEIELANAILNYNSIHSTSTFQPSNAKIDKLFKLAYQK